jgi:hypothetical protein
MKHEYHEGPKAGENFERFARAVPPLFTGRKIFPSLIAAAASHSPTRPPLFTGPEDLGEAASFESKWVNPNPVLVVAISKRTSLVPPTMLSMCGHGWVERSTFQYSLSQAHWTAEGLIPET